METDQLNLRVSKQLIHDLDIISSILKINRSEWVKTRLCEEANEEKNRLLMEISTLYAKGGITKKQVQAILGKEIAEEMESIREGSIKSAKAGIAYGKRLKRKSNL